MTGSYHLLKFSILVIVGIFMLAALHSCMPDQTAEKPELRWSLDNDKFRTIYDFQNQFQADSLSPLIHHPEAAVRWAAVKAFASIRDSSYFEIVLPALMDSAADVAAMAAYALGQMGNQGAEEPLINAFRADDAEGNYNLLNSRILEAIGKCGGEDALQLLSTIETYLPSDTLLLKGQTKGIYQFALRRMTTSEGTSTMVNYLTSRGFPAEVRLIAANYLARATDIDLSSYAYNIGRIMESDRDPYIRMALALAAPKAKSERVRQLLSKMAIEDNDYRVRVNALRGLELMRPGNLNEVLMNAVFDPHPSVSLTAASALIRNLDEHNASFLHEQENISRLDYRTKSRVLAASLKNMPFYYAVSAANVNNRLKRLFEQSENQFEREAWIFALSHDPINLEYILEQLSTADDAFFYTNTLLHLENLLTISRQKPATNFNRGVVLRKISDNLRDALLSEDAGKIIVASDIIRRNKQLVAPQFQDKAFFEKILEELSVPSEIQVYNQLVILMNELFEEGVELLPVHLSKPIDWELYLRLPDTVRIAIQLSGGEVLVALPKEANPATVTNLVALILDGYYNGKNIHRVVPNFVIQGGCPRGDGYGSADFTIPSELSPTYFNKAGLIGMASAGNHTESVQWFITHSPAMHLDGKYTQFGEVYRGMDVVHNTTAGTVIEKIELLNE